MKAFCIGHRDDTLTYHRDGATAILSFAFTPEYVQRLKDTPVLLCPNAKQGANMGMDDLQHLEGDETGFGCWCLPVHEKRVI